VLISFYAYLPPKRADLGAVKIARCKTPGACTKMVERCNDGNFILGDIGILVLNEYKTYESYKSLPKSYQGSINHRSGIAEGVCHVTVVWSEQSPYPYKAYRIGSLRS
jgi:hypothetical protein